MNQPPHVRAGLYEAVTTFRRLGDDAAMPELTLRLQIELRTDQAGPVFERRQPLWRQLAATIIALVPEKAR